jgi:hypothetical protein
VCPTAIDAQRSRPISQNRQKGSREREVLEEMRQLILIGEIVMEDYGRQHALAAEEESHNACLEPGDEHERTEHFGEDDQR